MQQADPGNARGRREPVAAKTNCGIQTTVNPMANTLVLKQQSRFSVDSVWLVALVWTLFVAVVNPIGNFPLNDDWSYAIAVQRLLETGHFHPTGWTSMTLLAHVLWGALFCLPFGFSFTALRVATLVAAALGIVAFARLLQLSGCGSRKSTLATAALAFNPLYLSQAHTFMTDITFAASALFAILLFCRYLQTRRITYFAAALALVLVSLLIRQLALFLPLAMTATLFIDPQRQRRLMPLLVSAGSVLACAAILVAFEAWLSMRGVLPAAFHEKSNSLFHILVQPREWLGVVPRNSFNAIIYLGWFLFPVLFVRLPALYRSHMRSKAGRVVLIGGGLVAVASVAALFLTHHSMPLGWNIIQRRGLGPVEMRDAVLLPVSAVPKLPLVFWQIVTVLSVIGGTLLLLDLAGIVRRLIRRESVPWDDSGTLVKVFLLVGTLVYMGPLIFGGFYDRYLLVPIALLLALFALDLQHMERDTPPDRRTGRAVWTIAWLALVLTSGFAISSTHDYLSWNRARWQLVDRLFAKGIKPESIDGGLEVNGLYLYDPAYVTKPGKSWYWVKDDQYVLSFVPLPGYHTIDRADASGWLPIYRTDVLALQRDGAS